MKLGTLFYQTFIADPELRPKHFLGTAFPVTPDGGFVTCRHVLDVNTEDGDVLVILDNESNRYVPLGNVEYPKSPDLDIAFVHNALMRPKKEYFPILDPDQIIMGESVYSVGYFVAATNVDVGYFKGNIVNFRNPEAISKLTSMSLSYPIIEGLSGSPVLTYHNGPKVVGICQGSIQTRITASEVLEYQDDRKEFRETVTRIVELGLAYRADQLIGFLEDINVQGYVVTSQRVSGIFD